MELREKILQTFVVTIREINKHGGPEKFFEEYPVGGMYFNAGQMFFDENGLEVGSATTYERLEECKRHSKSRLLICADAVRMEGQNAFFNAHKSLGASLNLQDAYNYGKCIGMQINSRGIDWVLAPSIDMCFDNLMYLEAITNDPQAAVEIYTQVVKGIQDQGVAATIKHFPGLGTYFVNMHIAPGSNTMGFDEWMSTYGYVYKELIKAGVQSVMTTHVSLKSYDNEFSDGYYPIATYSKKLTTDLLKGELGFDGAVVTDALIMGGMATGDLVAETVQAFKAGADFLLWPPVEAAEAIEKAILDGEIPMSRLDDALERINRLKSFRDGALKAKNYDEPDTDFVDKSLEEIAKHGICLLRNDVGILPLKKDEHKKVLIVDVTDDDEVSSELLRAEIEKYGIKAEVKKDIYDVPSRVCWQSDIDDLQSHYDLVIFNVNAHFVAQWSVAHMLIWASHLFDKRKKIIVNYGSPYFAVDYFPEDPTFIEMNCSPSKETVELLAKGLFGETEFTGKSILKQYKTVKSSGIFSLL